LRPAHRTTESNEEQDQSKHFAHTSGAAEWEAVRQPHCGGLKFSKGRQIQICFHGFNFGFSAGAGAASSD
jgi:esterase/lipase superfamily enzyme